MNNLKIRTFFDYILFHQKKQQQQFMYPDASLDLQRILQKMQEFHLIQGYKVNQIQNETLIFLSYDRQGKSTVKIMKPYAKNKRRVIFNHFRIKLFIKCFPFILGFVRTSKGILTLHECSIYGYGGEILIILI
jgi:ribosomal protein S8